MPNEPNDKKQEPDGGKQQPATPAEADSQEQDKKSKPGGGAEERNIGG